MFSEKARVQGKPSNPVLSNRPVWQSTDDVVSNAESRPAPHMSVVAPGTDLSVSH